MMGPWLWTSIGGAIVLLGGALATGAATKLSDYLLERAGRAIQSAMNRRKRRPQPAAQEPRLDRQQEDRQPKSEVERGRPVVGDVHGCAPLGDRIEVEIMKLLAEHGHLTPRRAAVIVGCPLATAEHRFLSLSRRRLARSDSFGQGGPDYHLTFEGLDALKKAGLIE